MNGLDWAIVAILVLSVLLAAAQGFLHEVISLAGVVVGYLLAAWEYWRVARRIAPYVKSDAVAESVAFLGIFVAVVIAAGIIGQDRALAGARGRPGLGRPRAGRGLRLGAWKRHGGGAGAGVGGVRAGVAVAGTIEPGRLLPGRVARYELAGAGHAAAEVTPGSSGNARGRGPAIGATLNRHRC